MAAPIKRLLIALIDLYRRFISPMLPAACRFHPSCSSYARDAVELHGVVRGSAMAVWRLMRCQPFSRGGFDPVPLPNRPRARTRGMSESSRP